jgi:bifunctional non-homologous end joining protein LigD
VAFRRKKTEALGVKAPLPGFIEPALASSIAKVPSRARWIHEIKFDGYRVQIHLANEAVRIFTRRGHDWTHRFKRVAHDAWHIKAASAVIDGEVVVPAVDGSTDFSVLQNELKGSSKNIVLVAFDLLYLNGRDIRKLPLFQRTTGLKKVVASTASSSAKASRSTATRWSLTPASSVSKGVVSKVRDSRYPTGRSNDWIKKTCAQRETLTIAGFALDEGKWDGIYLGRRKGKDLVYAGKVDHGFDKTSAADLQKCLKPLIRKTLPYVKRIVHSIWVEPKLFAEIRSRRRAKSGIRPSRGCAKISDTARGTAGTDYEGRAAALKGMQGRKFLKEQVCQ